MCTRRNSPDSVAHGSLRRSCTSDCLPFNEQSSRHKVKCRIRFVQHHFRTVLSTKVTIDKNYIYSYFEVRESIKTGSYR